jgi:acetolactate decarboxylase
MRYLFILSFAAVLFATGCTSHESAVKHDTVFQTSTIDTLLAGVFDGNMSCGELCRQGNFGIGTFADLDGEMVLLDSAFYQIRADGKVYRPAPETTTPFATVCHFNPDICFDINRSADYNTVEQLIDAKLNNKNLFYAVKITGKFKSVKTRSVPRQNKPYPPLKVITASQPEFLLSDVEGDIVGFRCPNYVKGINVSGYHLHFISADRTRGGHILGFELEQGKCQIDTINQFFLRLPDAVDAFSNTDLAKDRSVELKNVEKASTSAK